MFNDDVPSYLGNSPQQEIKQPSYMDFPKPNSSPSIQPPTTQPSLQNSQINLPQIESNKQILPYSYRAGVSPYTSNIPYQKVMGNIGQISENIFPIVQNDSFKDSSISSSYILGGAVLGYYYGKDLDKMVGAKGYGAILGALGGNALSNWLKSSSINREEGIKSLGGSALSIAPLIIAAKMNKNMEGKTAYTIGSLAFGYLVYQRFFVGK